MSEAHSEIAASPVLPPGVTVPVFRGRVHIQLTGDNNTMSPNHARAVARALLLPADEAERQGGNDLA